MSNISYSAVALDDNSRNMLIKIFKPMIPDGWEIVAHHMTIKLGALDPDTQAKKDLETGREIRLNIDDYAINDKVMAVGVSGYETDNAKAHITLAVNRIAGSKPVISNQLTDWKKLGFPLTLTGKVIEVEFK